MGHLKKCRLSERLIYIIREIKNTTPGSLREFLNFLNFGCRLSERLRKVPPESLREFLNFLNFGGNLSKLTDTNSKTL